MPVELFANLATTTVSSGGTTAPASGTTETWTVASSASFPAASNTASPPTQFHVADTAAGLTGEIIAVTNVSGTTWTVTRGAESTATVAHTAGFTIQEVVSAGALSGMLQSANNLSDVGSASAARTNLGLTGAATAALPLSIANGGTGQATGTAALNALGGAVLSAQNQYTASQYFQPPAGANVVANQFTGRNGGWSYGIDSGAAIPSRDFFLGRVDPVPAGADTDLFYIQYNAQTTTLTAPVSAGATSLPVAGALTFTGNDGAGGYWVILGDNTAGNTQEYVQITAGRGTTTMTCAALANAHPSGALVTVGFDQANQGTFEFLRVGSAASSNKNWRVTVRPDITGSEPTLGALKIEIPPSALPTADYMEIASRDETQKAFRIQVDNSVSIESVTNDWTDTGCSTTSGSPTLTLNTVTPSDQMYGCFVTGAGIPSPGTYITAINAGAKTVTLSKNATATATGTLAVHIYKPVMQARQNAAGNYQPYFSVTNTGITFRGSLMIGSGTGSSGAGPGIPQADLHISGTKIFMDASSAQFLIQTNGSGNTQLQPWGITAITMGIVSTNPKLGFFNVTTPVAQPTAATVTAGFTASTGTTVVSGSTFTGNTGSTAYTIGDLVNALKTLGLITA